MGLFDFFRGKKENGKEIAKDESLLEEVEVIPGLSMPRAFALHWEEIKETKESFIAITASPADDLALEQSKFGHYPCMPVDFDYPRDGEGKPMFPLAQINCKELPALKGYPESGYLQFYISASDDIYGLDYDHPQLQTGFRVLFFEESEVEKYKADFSFLDEVMSGDMMPVYKPHGLNFITKEEYIGVGDVRYEEGNGFHLDKLAEKYPAIESELESRAYDIFSPAGHKIGGYANFTQEDPRRYKNEFKDFILLLQIDTDDEIMWGDSGVANFFIHPDDLLKKDFSKVLYNWDCC